MGAWQYQLRAIPLKEISRKDNSIPANIKEVKNPEFDINWWNKHEMDLNQLCIEIDQLITKVETRKKGYFAWKGDFENQQDNDCDISFDPENLELKTFHFRTDLRNKNNLEGFLKGMIIACKKRGLILVNAKQEIIKADYDLICENINQMYYIDREKKIIRLL